MFRPITFLTVLKNLYYDGKRAQRGMKSDALFPNGLDLLTMRPVVEIIKRNHDPNEVIEGNSISSGAFVNAMKALLDGRPLILNSPHYRPYSERYLKHLVWRCHLFRDELAMFMMQENWKKFYQN